MKINNILFILAFGFCSLVHADEQKTQEPLHLTLSQAIHLAAKQNAQVFAANERVRQAIANISASRAALLPQVTATLGGKRQTEDLRASGIQLPGDPHIGPFNSFDMRGRLTMDIFDPQVIERLASAKAGVKFSQAEFQKVKQDILALTGTLYLEAQRASQSVGLNKMNLKQTFHQYKIIQTALDQGTASISDLDKARMDLAQARYLFKASQVHAQQSRLDLASALKIPLDQPIIFDEDKEWTKKELAQANSIPEIAATEAQVTQSKSQVREAKAGFLPTITALGDLGQSGKSPSASSSTYSVGLAVSLPIWEGGLTQAQLKTAQSKMKENEILLEDIKDQSRVKVKEAKNNLEQAKALLVARAQQLKYARRRSLIFNNRLKNGSASQLDIDEANSGMASAIDEKNESQALYWTAKINLAHAMGNVDQLFDIK